MARKTTKTMTKAVAAPAKTAKLAKKSKTMTAQPKRKPATTHKLIWQHATCRVKHTPDYMSEGWSHIEISVQAPKGAPIPITRTGYLSHFLDEDELTAAGGPVAFVSAWIEREARSKDWARADFKWRQGDLFG
jgi:hypothetical protein